MKVELTSAQREILLQLRDHDAHPYVRERAAAILKLCDGTPLMVVARTGLLRPRDPQTVYRWLCRFLAEGEAGLRVRPGRGRKPAFFPLFQQR